MHAYQMAEQQRQVRRDDKYENCGKRGREEGADDEECQAGVDPKGLARSPDDALSEVRRASLDVGSPRGDAEREDLASAA